MANEKNKRGLPEQLVELARKPGVIVGVLAQALAQQKPIWRHFTLTARRYWAGRAIRLF